VTVMALGLIAYGLGRSRLQTMWVHAYVSHQALVGSVTFIVIGLYLLAVGAVGTWLRATDESLGLGLSVVVVFGAIVGLVVAVFSKTVRAEIRRVLTRHFYRSKYDYRAQWLRVTEAFQQAADKDSIMDCLLDVLIKTFPTTHLSIWAFREADRRFCRVRSMTGEAEPAPIDLSHPTVVELGTRDDAVVVEPGAAGDPLGSSGAALCFPIRAQGKVIAFLALGSPLHGESYGTDDEDLLRGLAHHVGMLLAHARLTDERRASAELEALHRFSVFCMHDLKNLAARLSLVAQNAQRHGSNPAFQESAMRTVADTADKMAALMSKLSRKSFHSELGGAPEPVDLSRLLHEIVEPLRVEPSLRLQVSNRLARPVVVVREQIQQVLLNVVLNARQAISRDGAIAIALTEADGCARVTVEDTGCGIPPAGLENLFKPSQSSRPGGLGVGLYQCKQIVDAHRGTIQIRSEAGKGTEVTIELPLATTVERREAVAAREA
jgi:putative PEP-CTERM system histidine kinase